MCADVRETARTLSTVSTMPPEPAALGPPGACAAQLDADGRCQLVRYCSLDVKPQWHLPWQDATCNTQHDTCRPTCDRIGARDTAVSACRFRTVRSTTSTHWAASSSRPSSRSSLRTRSSGALPVCDCVRACVYPCACGCVMCARAHARACVCVFASNSHKWERLRYAAGRL